jgi:hypothetical protein
VETEDPSGALWREAIVWRGTNDKRRREAASQYVPELVAELRDRDEVAAFEVVSHPDVVRVEDAERSYAGQYRRRLRRLRERERHRTDDR